MASSNKVEEILNHFKAIEEQIDGICNLQYYISSVMPKYQGQKNESGFVGYTLDYEYQNEEDFIGAAYILTSFLCLANKYAEQINTHTVSICEIMKDDVNQDTVNSVYSNISGPFFQESPDVDQSSYDLSSTLLNNKANRFKEIYSSNFYAPKGTKYLKSINYFITEYWMACNQITEYIDKLRNVLIQ